MKELKAFAVVAFIVLIAGNALLVRGLCALKHRIDVIEARLAITAAYAERVGDATKALQVLGGSCYCLPEKERTAQ